MLLHEVSNSSSRIRLEIANGFTNKRPTHSSRRKIKPGVFSISSSEEEDEDEKKRKEERYDRTERSQG